MLRQSMFTEIKSAAKRIAVKYVVHDKGDNYFRKKQAFPGKSTKSPRISPVSFPEKS